MFQWLRLCVPNAGGTGLITRVPQTVCCSQKKKKKNPKKTPKKQRSKLRIQENSLRPSYQWYHPVICIALAGLLACLPLSFLLSTELSLNSSSLLQTSLLHQCQLPGGGLVLPNMLSFSSFLLCIHLFFINRTVCVLLKINNQQVFECLLLNATCCPWPLSLQC